MRNAQLSSWRAVFAAPSHFLRKMWIEIARVKFRRNWLSSHLIIPIASFSIPSKRNGIEVTKVFATRQLWIVRPKVGLRKIRHIKRAFISSIWSRGRKGSWKYGKNEYKTHVGKCGDEHGNTKWESKRQMVLPKPDKVAW